MLELSYDVDGKEAPKVQLLKDGKEVKFTSVDGRRHVYRVDEVKPEHQGVYKVVAEEQDVDGRVNCHSQCHG